MLRNGNLKKYISSIVLIMFMLSFMLVQAPAAQAKTLQTPIPDPANDVVVLNVEIGGQTLPYTWGDITGATGYKFAGQATSDIYTENDEGLHETCCGIKLADLLADAEDTLDLTLADDYQIKAVCSDAYTNAPFTVAEAKDYAANHYLLTHKVNDTSEPSVGYKDTDPSVTYPATYCRIARNRGGDFSIDRFGNTTYMRLISSLQIIQSDGSAVELIDNGAGLDLLVPDQTGLVIGGTGITNGAGLRNSFVYLSQDQVDSIKANKSVDGLGLGDSWTSTPMLYSSYDNHGTPEYVYRLAEGINLKTVLTALGADVNSAPVAIEATATDGYTAIVSDAFSHTVSRNYIAPDGTVGPVVDPILIFYDDKVTTSTPDSSLEVPTVTEAIADANPLFAYGQTEPTEETNCKFVKNTNKIRAGKVDPAFIITQDSNTKSISLSDIALIGIYETSYSWNNGGTLVAQSVTGVPLSVLLTELGVTVPSNEDLIIKVNDGSGTVASSRSISSSEISRCFVAFDAFADSERSERVSGSLTPLRIYCPGQTEDRVLIENVVGASVNEVSQTYTVSFEENGGTAVASITGVSGATIDTAPVTTKEGSELEGWYTDAGLTNQVVFPYTIVDDVKFYAKWTAESIVGDREPGGDINNSVFYIALKDASGETKYYYYTKAELETYETQEAYTYDDHSVIKTVTCKGALLTDLLNDLKGVSITEDMVVQYSEEDGYHADAATAVIDSNYKDTIESLTKSTIGGSGSTKNPLRPIVTYAIHEEYANPDAYNVNDPAGVFKDADNNSGYLRVYRDTGGANSAVMKYMMGVVISPDGALLSGKNGCVVTSVSDKNPTLKVRNDLTLKGLLPGMQYAVKAPAVTNAALAAGQTSPVLITVGSGAPAEQVITFQYTEDTYFYVKNAISKTTTNYTYTDLMAMSEQVPDANANTPPYGYSRPMYYRYNGVWLSDLVSGLSGKYTIKLVANDGTKTDITKNIADYFAAYNNTQSKTSTNIPEGKRVTVTYNDAKIIIPGTGENITGSAATDYTPAGKDVDVLVAAAEGLEIVSSGGGGGGGGGSSSSGSSKDKDVEPTEPAEPTEPTEPAQPTQPSQLNDIKGHWAEASIKNLVAAGAITGYPDGSFKADNTITRAEFATVLVKAYKLTATDGKIFADTGSHWAREAIATAAANGIITGYSDTAFGPDDPITREQMALMIVRAEKIAAQSGELHFTDTSSIATWARDAAASAVAAKLMSGYPDQTFRPQANATRAEAVSVIARALGQQ